MHVLTRHIQQERLHGPPAGPQREASFKFVNGKKASYNKWILGSFSDSEYLGAAGRWGTVGTFKDRDGDGVPDYSFLYGDELSITDAETLEALRTSHADTDGDGLSDLDEATRWASEAGCDVRVIPITDGDGLSDGSDPDPLDASRTRITGRCVDRDPADVAVRDGCIARFKLESHLVRPLIERYSVGLR